MKEKFLHRLYSLPLRVHLLAMALLLALPAFALIVQSGLAQRSEALHKGFSDARRLTSSLSREQHNIADGIEQLLTALVLIPQIQHRDVGATNAILFAILKKNPQYANIIIADRNGDVWASGLPMQRAFSIKDRRTFREALSTRSFSSGDFGIGKLSGKPSIGFGYPILNSAGEVAGVVTANIDFDELNDARFAGLPEGSSFSLIDRDGIFVNRSPKPEKFVGTKLSQELFLKMQQGPDRDTFIAEDFTGEKKVISYRKLKLPNEKTCYLYVRSAFPVEKLLERAQRALLVNIALLSSMLLAAILAVFYLGNLLFVKRIENLQAAALRLAEGDLQVRISDAAGGGEIGRLGQVFDQMAQRLSERQATLVASERGLSELNRDLTRKVEEETERRVHQERLLARHARLVAMGEMIGAIAHQWRQPLATLGATIQSIRMAWDRDRLDGPFLQKAEEDAQKQLYYMSDTIEDFRNFFTPEKVAERFDVREKVAEVIMLVTPQFAHSGVQLQTADGARGQDLCIRGYQNEFKQSLLNLVSNALDAICEKAFQTTGLQGGSAGNGTVTIHLARLADRIVVEVQDDGCGIAPGVAEKIFDPYFTTKPTDQGTGIGLYMTKLIIEESMAGRLSFQSGPHGTRFRIELAADDTMKGAPHG
jgi:C4-dicarboxylate-specific signal transduction histidine kinase